MKFNLSKSVYSKVDIKLNDKRGWSAPVFRKKGNEDLKPMERYLLHIGRVLFKLWGNGEYSKFWNLVNIIWEKSLFLRFLTAVMNNKLVLALVGKGTKGNVKRGIRLMMKSLKKDKSKFHSRRVNI